MRDTRFTPERADLGPRQAEECAPVSQVCRRMGMRRRANARGIRQFGQR